MKKLMITTALGAGFMVGAAQAAVFDFNQQGYEAGGNLVGFFEGEDLNGDGQIVSFDGEVTNLEATFQGFQFGEFGFETNFTFDSLTSEENGNLGLVYSLDGGATIGNDRSRAVEGLGLNNGEYSLAVGPGPTNISCDGETACGFVSEAEGGELNGPLIFTSSSEAISVTSGPVGTPFGSTDNPFMPTFFEQEEDETQFGFSFEIFDFEIIPGETFFIDPDIAVGYTYTIDGTTFSSVTAPTLAQVNDANAQYTLTVGGVESTINAGEEIDFALGVTEFTLTGIDVTPGLDPNDPLAFITGVSVGSISGSSIVITQTPIVEPMTMPAAVPLPAGMLLLAPGLMLLGGLRRRKT